jgi:tetratricopeptide (TPR) repeat protein
LRFLALYLIGLGRKDEALAPMRDAVDISRRISAPNDTLASNLYILGACLHDLNRDNDAFAPINEAVRIYQQLTNSDSGNPATYLRELAKSLAVRALTLRERDVQTAVESMEQAVACWTTLAQQASQAIPKWALTALADLLEKADRREEAAEVRARLSASGTATD